MILFRSCISLIWCYCFIEKIAYSAHNNCRWIQKITTLLIWWWCIKRFLFNFENVLGKKTSFQINKRLRNCWMHQFVMLNMWKSIKINKQNSIRSINSHIIEKDVFYMPLLSKKNTHTVWLKDTWRCYYVPIACKSDKIVTHYILWWYFPHWKHINTFFMFMFSDRYCW